jgi:hypothetical protein
MANASAIVAGVAFVTLAAINVVVMLEASQPSLSAATRNRLIAVHRTSGYLFVILLCIMAYSMNQRLVGVGITGHLPYAPGSAHCACARPCASALPEDIDRTPLQGKPFVAEGTGNSNLRNFIRACVHSHSLGTSSFGEPRKPGVKARDRLDCYSVPGPMCLGLQKKKTIAGFHGVAYSGDSSAVDRINQARKRQGPNESSVGTDRAANARYEGRYAFRYQRKDGFVPSQGSS